MTRADRLALLDWDRKELALKTQAELLGLNRSGLYYTPRQPGPEELGIKHEIDKIFTQHPYYGSRRISAALRRQGLVVNRKAVQRHMREMGLEAIYPGPNLSRRNHDHKVFPYLLRNVVIDSPDFVWGTDITYIRLTRGWMYLVAIMDWYSRYIVSWELSDSLDTSFVVAAVKRGLGTATPGIINSDQGTQYTAVEYIDAVLSAGVRISMDGKGRAIDNVFTERFWRSLKYEEVYPNEYYTPREAREGINRYIDFYNYERPHQSLGYRTPAEVYRADAGATIPPALIHRSSQEGGNSSLNHPHSVS